jgi:hypothetical protein
VLKKQQYIVITFTEIPRLVIPANARVGVALNFPMVERVENI